MILASRGCFRTRRLRGGIRVRVWWRFHRTGGIDPNAALQSLALGLEAAGLGTSSSEASGSLTESAHCSITLT